MISENKVKTIAAQVMSGHESSSERRDSISSSGGLKLTMKKGKTMGFSDGRNF